MHKSRSNNTHNYPLTDCIHQGFKLSVLSITGYCDVINRRSLAARACIERGENVYWWERQNQMAPAIASKRGFLTLVLWVLKGRNGYRVIIRIEIGHSNLLSCFGPRIWALARCFTWPLPRLKHLSKRPPKHNTRFEWPVLILHIFIFFFVCL